MTLDGTGSPFAVLQMETIHATPFSLSTVVVPVLPRTDGSYCSGLSFPNATRKISTEMVHIKSILDWNVQRLEKNSASIKLGR